VPILHSLGVLSFGLLLVLVALLGVFLAPYYSAQRLVLPELVGEDERVVAQANAVVEGAQRATQLLGPALAGLLIASVGATKVLYVDAATFLVSFLLLALFVPQREPLAPGDEAKGVFAGVRFILSDRLLFPLAVTALLLNGFGQMLVAGLPVLAYDQFDGSSQVAGALFAALGAGAVLGSVVAIRVVSKHDPIRLGAVSLVALTLPLWLLGLDLPVVGVMAVLFASSFFGPLVNAPLIGVITTRTPEALRAKVMTAVLTMALLAGPAALLIAGPLLESWGAQNVFLLVAAGELIGSLPFAFVALRRRSADPAPA
jgi:MFS family permease